MMDHIFSLFFAKFGVSVNNNFLFSYDYVSSHIFTFYASGTKCIWPVHKKGLEVGRVKFYS